MAIVVESASSYGTDGNGAVGFSHNIVSGAGSNRMTLLLLHSVSADNAPFTGVAMSGVTGTFLATLTSLRAGLYHRLDIYYAGDSKTGTAGNHTLTATTAPSHLSCQFVVITCTGVTQLAPTNYGNVASKVAGLPSPSWVGLISSAATSGLRVKLADVSGLNLSTANVYGFVPASNDQDTCQGLLYLSNGTNALLFCAEY